MRNESSAECGMRSGDWGLETGEVGVYVRCESWCYDNCIIVEKGESVYGSGW